MPTEYTEELVIDLKNINQTVVYKKNEIFQRDAYDEAVQKLRNLLTSSNAKSNETDITKRRRHDTIFIDGERGTGKTSFLINIEQWIEADPSHSNSMLKQLAFIGPIDPTLLYNNEDFLGVILGTIVEKLNNHPCLIDGDNKEKLRRYYNALEAVSESLKAVFDLKKGEVSGIDAIASHASSKNLEKKTHAFFEAVTDILDKEALILLIDDVDMAFEKGFDVLETIRKFLASPYLIPIVSGDAKLYKHLIKKEFTSKLFYKENEFGPKELERMVDQYFNKVMPNDLRIELKSIPDLRKRHPILLKTSTSKQIYYNQFKDFDIQLINYGINQVRYTAQVFPKNLRSFVQYLAKKQDIINAIDEKDIHLEDNSHKPYKPGKEKEIVDQFYMNNFKLFLKSIEETKSFYQYSSDLSSKRLAQMLQNDLGAVVDESYISPYRVFKGSFFQEEIEHDTNKSSKASNIEKEKLITTLYFHKGSLNKFLIKSSSQKEKIILRLFYHDDYYNKSSSRRAYIVGGKFVEAILYSFSIHEKDATKTKANELKGIANGMPYNLDIKDNTIDDDPEEKDEQENANIDNSAFDELAIELQEYNTQLKDVNLYISTNLLQNILVRFFNNLNALKESKEIYNIIQNDQGFNFMARICAILLNAVAFFENVEDVEEAYIAMGKNTFSFENLKSTSVTYRKNIQPLIDEKGIEKNKKLTNILFHHPIIKFFINKKNSEILNIDLIEKKGTEKTKEINKIIETDKIKKTKEIRDQRWRILKKNNSTTIQSLTSDKVKAYFNDIEQTQNNDLFQFILNYLKRKGTIENAMKDVNKIAVDEFIKKHQ